MGIDYEYIVNFPLCESLNTNNKRLINLFRNSRENPTVNMLQDQIKPLQKDANQYMSGGTKTTLIKVPAYSLTLDHNSPKRAGQGKSYGLETTADQFTLMATVSRRQSIITL